MPPDVNQEVNIMERIRLELISSIKNKLKVEVYVYDHFHNDTIEVRVYYLNTPYYTTIICDNGCVYNVKPWALDASIQSLCEYVIDKIKYNWTEFLYTKGE